MRNPVTEYWTLITENSPGIPAATHYFFSSVLTFLVARTAYTLFPWLS